MTPYPTWLSLVRKRALSRRSPIGASAVVLANPWPPEGLDVAATTVDHVEASFPDDLVLAVDLPTLLADRVTIGLAVLRALLLGEMGVSAVQRLRRMVPGGRDVASWLANDQGMTHEGAACVAEALAVGDFDAIMTLTASELRESHDEYDPIHVRSALPLKETEARQLLEVLLGEPGGRDARWVVLTGVEEILGGASPSASPFRASLKLWMQRFLHLPNTVFIAAGWSGAVGQLDTIDRALRRDIFWMDGANEADGDLRLDITAPRLVAGLGLLARAGLSAYPGEPVWIGLGESTAVVLAWPESEADPARWVARCVAEVVESFAGARVALVVPVWAMGRVHGRGRAALTRAFPAVTWVPLTHCASVALCAMADGHGGPGLERALAPLRRGLEAAWRRPEGGAD